MHKHTHTHIHTPDNSLSLSLSFCCHTCKIRWPPLCQCQIYPSIGRPKMKSKISCTACTEQKKKKDCEKRAEKTGRKIATAKHIVSWKMTQALSRILKDKKKIWSSVSIECGKVIVGLFRSSFDYPSLCFDLFCSFCGQLRGMHRQKWKWEEVTMAMGTLVKALVEFLMERRQSQESLKEERMVQEMMEKTSEYPAGVCYVMYGIPGFLTQAVFFYLYLQLWRISVDSAQFRWPIHL